MPISIEDGAIGSILFLNTTKDGMPRQAYPTNGLMKEQET
jgi:hypothetical protein